MEKYPDTNAVLVRRHGVYVWGGKFFSVKKNKRHDAVLIDLFL